MRVALAYLVFGLALIGVGSTGRRLSRLADTAGKVSVGFAFGFACATVLGRVR